MTEPSNVGRNDGDMSDTVTTYTCQADNCERTGTNKSDFKKVEYRDAISFAFVMCNEHAEQLIWSKK